MMNSVCKQFLKKNHHGLIPAVPVPFRQDGMLDEQAQEQYVRWMAEQPVAGIAVWAHTGRGLYLTPQQREIVFKSWRTGFPDKPIITGIGGDPDASSNVNFFASARNMTEHAARLGADAFLVYPPSRFRNLPDVERDKAILKYHSLFVEYGKPLILFFLYEAAGGITYSDSVLHELLSLPEVAGIKIATLDSIITFQNIAAFVRDKFPDKLVITGEDRFFGYSLMCGAQAALIGMGSALCEIQSAMMKAYFEGQAQRFLALSNQVDMLACTAFGDPVKLYIRRMLWILADQGIISPDAVHDPKTQELDATEKIKIKQMVRSLAYNG